MSNHREMTLQDAYDMLLVIRQGLQEVRNGDKFALLLVIVLLYEYCLCYSFFQVHPNDKRASKPLNHKDIKSFVNSDVDENFNYCVNSFSTIRNKIAHCDTVVYCKNDVLYLIMNKYFDIILRRCVVPDDIIMAVSMYYEVYPINDPREFIYSLTDNTIPNEEIDLCVTYKDCIELVNKYK